MAVETAGTRTAAALPAIVGVRTQATVAGHDAIVIRFESGARLRYVDDDPVREEWLAPGDETPTRTNRRETPVQEAALGAVGAYLSFDDRAHASFVWGEENVDVLAP
ncbi:hypothetical protein [Halosegnis sp.]|uniref:hypothetical protein n=1 Tax=Halosegnis sp. TaxID=2864959 RepID=UPI0035D4D0A0